MLRIAIVAHGRFHAFDLARELARLGHDVHVFGNYPRWAVARFGLAPERYRGLSRHGVVERMLRRLAPSILRRTEAGRHRWFGRWAARQLERRPWDVIHCWSGVSEELLADRSIQARARVLMRGSSHIAEQAALLTEEERRTGVTIDRPSAWMIAREEREYAIADHIVVLSEFARASFARHGVHADRVTVLPLGVDVDAFRPSTTDVRRRIDRVSAGAPLRVLFVGTLSARKGLRDVVATARRCLDLPMTFTLVGPSIPESGALLSDLPPNVIVAGPKTQEALPGVYADADVFLFPTIEDGFAMVLTQATAAGLVLMASTNCAAPDLLTDGAQGWSVPIRNVDGMVERLQWCHEHRESLAALLERAAATPRHRDWAEVAEGFAGHAECWIAGRVEKH